MKFLLRFSCAALGGLLLASPAMADSRVVRCLVRDANGNARTAYVRVSDRRVLYPQVVRKVVKPGQPVEYRPAVSSAYRPGAYGYGYGARFGSGSRYAASNGYIYGIPGRRFYPVGTGYPNYYLNRGNYGVDSILYHGNRGAFGIPGYGLPGGAFPRPVVKPQLPGLPPARYSGNVKGR